MDPQNVVSTYNGLLLSLKKEGISDMLQGMHFEDIMLSEIIQSQKILYD